MIKTFDESNNSSTIEEGLFDKLKARKQIIEVQGIVIDLYMYMNKSSGNPAVS